MLDKMKNETKTINQNQVVTKCQIVKQQLLFALELLNNFMESKDYYCYYCDCD